MTELKNSVNIKEIPENEDLKKVVNILEKIIDFSEKQKCKEFKILTPKKILQRLPIAVAQVKAASTSENLLNEIGQIIYSLHHEKEVTKKVYNNLMNSIKV